MAMESIAKFVICVCLVGMAASMPASNGGDFIPESVMQFGNMIGCTTGLGKTRSLLDYNGYGCYCGLGGSGTALDQTDECCVKHDHCYNKVMVDKHCLTDNHIYAIDYEYEWDKCGTPDHSITCKRSEDYTNHAWPVCAEMMCECDKLGAICFAAERTSYNDDFSRYDKDLCV